MKLFRLALLGLLASVFWSVNAQDVITLKNGDEIKAKVTEMTSSEIKYKRFDNLDGPMIVIEKAKVFAINYENGTREVFNVIEEPARVQEPITVSPVTNKQAKPNVGVFFNPTGFIAFGPMVGVEFSAGKFDIEATVFFPKSGMLLKSIIADGDKNYWLKGSCFGFFVAPKFYTNRTNGGFYAGGCVGYWKIATFNYPDGYSTPAGIIFGTNVGYKFVLPFGMYFRTGAYFGASVNTNYYWYPNSQYQIVEDYSGDVTIFGCLDLALGFNFLKVKR